MKKSNGIFILTIFLVFICCVGAASATEIDDAVGTGDEAAISQEVPAVDEQNTLASSEVEVDSANDNQNVLASSEVEVDSANDNQNVLASQEVNDNLKENSSEYVIWVGPNENDGNGSESNPFATFDLACDDVSSGKENVVINVLDGTYYLGSHLKFNTTNIHIIGVGDNVVIKNKIGTEGPGHTIPKNVQQAFGLVSTSGNFRISNITFDGSTWDVYSSPDGPPYNSWFNIFKGSGDKFSGNYTVTLDNCNIVNFKWFLSEADRNNPYQYKFNKCNFIYDGHGGGTYYKLGYYHSNVYYKDCIFNIKVTSGVNIDSTPKYVNITYDDCWFGVNAIPSYFRASYLEFYHFNSYGIFTISENYLGNNTYEIIGKLVRNGTSEIIDSLEPMTVTLSTSTGNLSQTTAILENGTFKVIYTSTSANNKLTATLDNAVVSVEFQNINISLDAPSITYGDAQNITVTLPEEYNGVIFVTVNNKTYNKTLELTDSVIVNIPDVLSAGTYDVSVIFVDTVDNEACPIYGSNTTTITVAKVSDYDFDATVNPTSVYIVDGAIVTLVLPDDATGNVSVKIGEGEAKIFDVNDLISINEFVAGNNTVNITYSGNDKYVSKSVARIVSASVKPTVINASDVSTTYNVAKDLVITLKDVDGNVLANKTVNVVVCTVNVDLTTDANGQASVDISKLMPDTYTATITFAGDDTYAGSNGSANVVVNKMESTITAPSVNTTYNVAKDLVITLKDVDGNVLANKIVNVVIGDINVNLTTDDNGQASIDISKLMPDTYTATITFAGNENYTESSTTAKVIINPETVNLNASYNVTVLDDGFVVTFVINTDPVLNNETLTIKFNGKEYNVTVVNGVANFTSNKVYANTYSTNISYAGSELYSNSSTSVDAIVKTTTVSKLNTFTYYYYNNDMGSDSEKGISQIKVVDSDGNPIKNGLVTITIMNKYKLKVRTNGEGIAKFTKAYKPGTYSVTATHNNKVTKLGNLVLKSVVNVPKVTNVKKSAKTTTIKITLKGTGPIKGKTVVVNLNKKSYKVTTDKNGVASFKVTQQMVEKLGVGKTYKIRVTYRMDSVAQSIKILK